MKAQKSNSSKWAVQVVGAIVLALVCGCRASAADTPMSLEQQKRFDTLQARGAQASLTVYPVVMGEGSFEDVAEVLAVLLEKAGMTDLETTGAAFRLPPELPFDQAADAFGAFVRDHPTTTDYALYAEFVGSPASGPSEIRGIIVDRSGRPVLVERQTPTDRAFKRARPSTPMTCCHFMAQRVRERLGIPDSARDDSGQGRIARRLAAKAPGPDQAEREAMERRVAVLKNAASQPTVAVLPVRLPEGQVGQTDAARLAQLFTERRLCTARAVDTPLDVEIQHSRNEQQVLWDLARAFQTHVKENPPEAEYALLADYIMHPQAERAWAVHFVLCDRAGEWVIVDFQNDHHADFKSIDPRTHDDCGRLVAKRLAGYLR